MICCLQLILLYLAHGASLDTWHPGRGNIELLIELIIAIKHVQIVFCVPVKTFIVMFRLELIIIVELPLLIQAPVTSRKVNVSVVYIVIKAQPTMQYLEGPRIKLEGLVRISWRKQW